LNGDAVRRCPLHHDQIGNRTADGEIAGERGRHGDHLPGGDAGPAGRARTDGAEIHDFTAPDFFKAIELNNPDVLVHRH
jgi:hypothetical protein